MAFFYGEPSIGQLGSDGSVEVLDIHPLKVVSVGVRGSYNSRHSGRLINCGRGCGKPRQVRGQRTAALPRIQSPFVPCVFRYGGSVTRRGRIRMKPALRAARPPLRKAPRGHAPAMEWGEYGRSRTATRTPTAFPESLDRNRDTQKVVEVPSREPGLTPPSHRSLLSHSKKLPPRDDPRITDDNHQERRGNSPG